MNKRLSAMLGLAIGASLLLSACGAATPTAVPPKPTEAPKPTAVPATAVPPTAAPKPTDVPKPTAVPATAVPPTAAPKKLKVGLVTDVGSLDDKSFNASAWAGVQRAMKDFGIEAKAIESKQPTDYQKNIGQFVNEKYDLIITVGFLMGDDTAKAAGQYPDQKMAIVDVGYYDDKAPKNVMGLNFAEDQSGFLAGTLAGLMTKSNVLGGVYGLAIPPVCKFRKGYEAGIKSVNANAKVFGVYQGPSDGTPFQNPAWGAARAKDQIQQKADVIFSAGGNTGNGGLEEIAKATGVLGIGVDQDQFLTLSDNVKKILLTSAMKRVDQATYLAVKDVVDGKFKGGNVVFDIKNDGIGLAPYHDLDSKVSADIKTKVDAAIKGLKDGTLKTGVDPAADPCK
ncbi:MAG TPA: BMP family ABC transporter substrate-binding protein [Thermoflexales bacterium]|nr:BMP family ABC transporter substrate-binding protein [Thermoflexales bacterium]HQX09560.1 BMP family ABC transporter substrate-binding protein [Thermoflexales bacterium]HQY24600.1 BMP family ABC transporter substrate-binding protein [Thermoflexales bacterium]HQZ52635.1 BMP family ABC transporter substrate-binding protein [Thermoflexales bacterium]HRA54201.1 BMP family ABC transporter substrate-binding protein [Thermoflexales bacterium]